MMNAQMSTDLRSMVREVLRDVMAQRAQAALSAVESVRIVNDHDLAAFVARLMDAGVQERVKAGKLRFTLGGAFAAPAPQATGAPLTGVVTEKTIDRHAGGGVLVLAAGAVLTPLARDRARKLGLRIERRP